MGSIRIVFTCLVLASGVSVFFFFPAAEKERVKGKNIVHLKGHPGCCFLGPRGVGGGAIFINRLVHKWACQAPLSWFGDRVCLVSLHTVAPLCETTSQKPPPIQNTKILPVKSLQLQPLVSDRDYFFDDSIRIFHRFHPPVSDHWRHCLFSVLVVQLRNCRCVRSSSRKRSLPVRFIRIGIHWGEIENGETEQWRRRRYRKRQKKYRLLVKQQLCTSSTLFCTFLCPCCTTTTWNFVVSLFMENGNGRQQFSFSFSDMNLDTVI